jgi:hypothetical protein
MLASPIVAERNCLPGEALCEDGEAFLRESPWFAAPQSVALPKTTAHSIGRARLCRAGAFPLITCDGVVSTDVWNEVPINS